jgi:hypothetical protein
MSSFFSETCKVLGIQQIHTSSFHSESNGMADTWHRPFHTGLSHLVNNSHKDWNVQLPFFTWRTEEPHTPPPGTVRFICCTGERCRFPVSII